MKLQQKHAQMSYQLKCCKENLEKMSEAKLKAIEMVKFEKRKVLDLEIENRSLRKALAALEGKDDGKE